MYISYVYVYVYHALVHFSTSIDFYRGCWYGAFGMMAQKKIPYAIKYFAPLPQEICGLAPLPDTSVIYFT